MERITIDKTAQDNLFAMFKEQNEALEGRVHRVNTSSDALTVMLDEIKRAGAADVVAAHSSLIEEVELRRRVNEQGGSCKFNPPLDIIEQAGIGICEYELGIADTGTIVHDASEIHTRLVSMLPLVHIALLRTSSLVETFEKALEIITRTYDGRVPDFLALVTGPSRTSDIECVSTIGVHGPKSLIIICIDHL